MKKEGCNGRKNNVVILYWGSEENLLLKIQTTEVTSSLPTGIQKKVMILHWGTAGTHWKGSYQNFHGKRIRFLFIKGSHEIKKKIISVLHND